MSAHRGDEWAFVPVLTHHPLQRVGATALAVLAEADSVAGVDSAAFEAGVGQMTADLLRTVTVDKAKDAGGFWLGVSYLFWPNSPMNPTARGKQDHATREEQILRWRKAPQHESWPGVPCALCTRRACGFYGKVDVPLAESTSHRNTTTRGHEGLALCFGCLSSFHALPYACRIHGGRATVVHSWDEKFLWHTTINQVHDTRIYAQAGGPKPVAGAYLRQRLALARLRSYESADTVTADVDLMVFSNSNKDQSLDIHNLQQRVAAWLRSTAWSADRATAFRYLTRAMHTSKVAGSHMLANVLFTSPDRLPQWVAGYLRACSASTRIPAESAMLADLCFSYVTEVLSMPTSDIDQIRALAARIADHVGATGNDKRLRGFLHAERDSKRLRTWLKKTSTLHTLVEASAPVPNTAENGRPREPFITMRQLHLLFDPDPAAASWHRRDLLVSGVLEELQLRGWTVDSGQARSELEDDDVLDPALFDETLEEEPV
ncbi:hypothetical protein [Amycolatopsis anabasis]|uniref:hypothetical protein n=1 Tax=Amycolatopsis anabasis TaxID=1840409 RepID=UPI00131ECE02|nr:hypothetical protein [Amycolatopsis anabasis]